MNSSFDALNHDNARLRFEINKNVLNYWALPPSTAKLEVAGMRMLREKKLLCNKCTLSFEATIKDNCDSKYLKHDRKQHLTQFDCGSGN